jgi:hypothetical protein
MKTNLRKKEMRTFLVLGILAEITFYVQAWKPHISHQFVTFSPLCKVDVTCSDILGARRQFCVSCSRSMFMASEEYSTVVNNTSVAEDLSIDEYHIPELS